MLAMMTTSRMHDRSPTYPSQRDQLREALDHIEGLILEGLRHGFFDYSVACKIGRGGRRQLVVRAGKSQKFTIPEDELPG